MNSITKSVSCDSCGNDITVLNVGKDPELPLCMLCKPWVTNSLVCSPRKVIGFAIDDLGLFRKYRTITKGIKIPCDDYSWNLFICAVLKANGDNDLLEKVQQDYQARLQIHPELRDFLTISWSEIPKNNVPRKTYSDVDIVNDIISTFKSYEKEKQHLITTHHRCEKKYLEYISTPGNFDDRTGYSLFYADYETAKKKLEEKLYNIQSITILGKIIGDVLSIEAYDCISREFIIQILYDYVKSDQSYPLDDTLSNIQKSVIWMYCHMGNPEPFKTYPSSPLVFEILSKIISDDYCKNSLYSILSVIANNNDIYDQSCNYYHRDRKIWQKSFQLLGGVIRTLTFSNVIICNDKLKVRGKSGRWYVVEPRKSTPTPHHDIFVVSTLNEEEFVCIHHPNSFRNMPMPPGDLLASLLMTLHNDNALFNKIDVTIGPHY